MVITIKMKKKNKKKTITLDKNSKKDEEILSETLL